MAKERTSQLNAGDPPLVSGDNDKNTVIALREIGEGKISVKTLEDSAINKLRKQQEVTNEFEEPADEHEDNFDRIYKGEVSKNGAAILPSKRIRRFSEKINLDSKISNNKSDKQSQEQKPKEIHQALPADNKSEQ